VVSAEVIFYISRVNLLFCLQKIYSKPKSFARGTVFSIVLDDNNNTTILLNSSNDCVIVIDNGIFILNFAVKFTQKSELRKADGLALQDSNHRGDEVSISPTFYVQLLCL
jgi:hypothetical protein